MKSFGLDRRPQTCIETKTKAASADFAKHLLWARIKLPDHASPTVVNSEADFRPSVAPSSLLQLKFHPIIATALEASAKAAFAKFLYLVFIHLATINPKQSCIRLGHT